MASIFTMAAMKAALPYVAAGMTVLSAANQYKAGKEQNKAFKYDAKVATQQAQQERAAAQRDTLDARRQGMILASRAQAAAASSGAGALDPTVVNVISGLQGGAEAAGLASMYQGASRARALEHDATVSRYTGAQAKTAGMFSSFNTLLSGADTFINRNKKP